MEQEHINVIAQYWAEAAVKSLAAGASDEAKAAMKYVRFIKDFPDLIAGPEFRKGDHVVSDAAVGPHVDLEGTVTNVDYRHGIWVYEIKTRDEFRLATEIPENILFHR
jgi:hypothetical protein